MTLGGRARAWAGAAVGLSACHAGLPSAAKLPPTAGTFTVAERAETGPITAIAARPPYLWAAGAPGLRRWNVATGDYETIAVAGVAGGGPVAAIAIDDAGDAWIAGASGVGRWRDGKGGLRYEPLDPPAPVTVVAPRRSDRGGGAWAGGPGGLYRFDGRSWAIVDQLRGVAVTALVLDGDGRGAWVGTRGQGLFHAGDDGAAPVAGNAAIALDDVVGVATTASGTRVAAGNAGGRTRLYLLTRAGVEGYAATTDAHVLALLDAAGDALLIAGPPGRERGYRLRPVAPERAPPRDSLRFESLSPERAGRWAAIPIDDALPPGVTAVAAAGADVYCGTQRLGVARAARGAAVPLEGSELVGDAARLFVACASREDCVLVTDGPRAWRTAGDSYRPADVGQPRDGTVLALTTDARGTIYALAAEPRFAGLTITTRAPGRDDWRAAARVPLELPATVTPSITFAAFAPAASGVGALWIGLRLARAAGGDDVGFGAAEIDVAAGRAIQHRPYRDDEHLAPESLPLPADLTGVLFDGPAIWFSSLAGVLEFQVGQLRAWGENDGFDSELVHAIARGADGTVWAATSEGLDRFDARTSSWRPTATAPLATRGLAVDGAGRLWLATGKGLRVLAPGQADPAAAPVVIAGDMRDVTVDRFGRVWALASTSIAVVEQR